MPVILKFITRLGIEQGTSNLYGLTPLAACQVGHCSRCSTAAAPPLACVVRSGTRVSLLTLHTASQTTHSYCGAP